MRLNQILIIASSFLLIASSKTPRETIVFSKKNNKIYAKGYKCSRDLSKPCSFSVMTVSGDVVKVSYGIWLGLKTQGGYND